MNRIDKKFKDLRERDETALITFISAGVPDLETTKDLIINMEKIKSTAEIIIKKV